MSSSKSMQMGPLGGSFFSMFIRNQFRTTLPSIPKDTDLSGRVAIITGGSSGLGFESARQMLSLGLSHLIITARSPERGKAAASTLQKANPGAKIEVWSLEMGSYDSIQEFARRCDKDLNRIDVVVLSVGLIPGTFTTVPSTGHEKAIQINYLSTMLLAILLLPVLKAKKSASLAPPRMTVVNSVMANLAGFPNRNEKPLLPSFDNEKEFSPSDRYSVSKLIGQLFLAKLVTMVDPNDVSINMLEPGFIKGTGLSRDFTGIIGIFQWLFAAAFARPIEKGGLAYVNAAFLQDGKASHGCFLMNCEIAPLTHLIYTPEAKDVTDQLWEETLREFEFAGAREIVKSL